MSDTASDTLITSSLPLPLTSGNVENTLLLSSQGKTLRTSLEAPLATVSRTLETMTAAHNGPATPPTSPAPTPAHMVIAQNYQSRVVHKNPPPKLPRKGETAPDS